MPSILSEPCISAEPKYQLSLASLQSPVYHHSSQYSLSRQHPQLHPYQLSQVYHQSPSVSAQSSVSAEPSMTSVTSISAMPSISIEPSISTKTSSQPSSNPKIYKGFHHHCHHFKQARLLSRHHLNQASQYQCYQSLHQLVLLAVASLQRILPYRTGQHHNHHLNPTYNHHEAFILQYAKQPAVRA